MKDLDAIVGHCSNRLGITSKYLAHLLGLTESGLHSEKGQERLQSMNDFLIILKEERPDLDGQDALFFIEDERLVFDPSDVEDGHCSYLTAIVSLNKTEEEWKAILKN